MLLVTVKTAGIPIFSPRKPTTPFQLSWPLRTLGSFKGTQGNETPYNINSTLYWFIGLFSMAKSTDVDLFFKTVLLRWSVLLQMRWKWKALGAPSEPVLFRCDLFRTTASTFQQMRWIRTSVETTFPKMTGVCYPVFGVLTRSPWTFLHQRTDRSNWGVMITSQKKVKTFCFGQKMDKSWLTTSASGASPRTVTLFRPSEFGPMSADADRPLVFVFLLGSDPGNYRDVEPNLRTCIRELLRFSFVWNGGRKAFVWRWVKLAQNKNGGGVLILTLLRRRALVCTPTRPVKKDQIFDTYGDSWAKMGPLRASPPTF